MIRSNAVARLALAVLATSLGATSIGCKRCSGYVEEPTPTNPVPTIPDEDEDEGRDARSNPQFWRIQVVVVGQGHVSSTDLALQCGTDGATSAQKCGPVEWGTPVAGGSTPPASMLTAHPAAGWTLKSWDGDIHHADGRVTKRRKISVNTFYVNYFRSPYDRADYELVTVTFVNGADGDAQVSSSGASGTAP